MINEQFTNMVCDHVEMEYSNPLRIKERKAFVLGAHFAYGFFSPDLEKLEAVQRIVAVARMVNNSEPDIRMTNALRDLDKVRKLEGVKK